MIETKGNLDSEQKALDGILRDHPNLTFGTKLAAASSVLPEKTELEGFVQEALFNSDATNRWQAMVQLSEWEVTGAKREGDVVRVFLMDGTDYSFIIEPGYRNCEARPFSFETTFENNLPQSYKDVYKVLRKGPIPSYVL